MDPVEVGRLEPREWLGRRIRVVIDRPLGSTHPGGGFDYPVNYGYVPGVVARRMSRVPWNFGGDPG